MTRRIFKPPKDPKYGFDTQEETELYEEYFIRMYTKDDLKLSLLQLVKRENLRGVKLHYTQAQRILKKHGIRLRKHRRYKEKGDTKLNVYLDDDMFYTLEKYDLPMSFLIGKLTKCMLGLDNPDMCVTYLNDVRPIIFMVKQESYGENHIPVQIIAPKDITETEESLLMAVGEMAAKESAPIEWVKQYFKAAGRAIYGGTTKQLVDPRTQFKKRGS